MIQLIQQRGRCIGCNACVEVAAYRWRMSKKDGRCTLIGGLEKKGFFILNVQDTEEEDALRAARHCPVSIIQVKKLR